MKQVYSLLLLIALLLLPVPVMAQVAQPSTSTQTATSRRTNNGRTTTSTRQNTSRSNNNSHRQTTANTMTAKQMYKLAEDYYYGYNGKRKNYLEALNWYRKAAAKGYASAWTALGRMYDEGLGVKKNKTEALRLYRRGAERGSCSGQEILGLIYLRGEGVPQSYAEAIKWFKRATNNPNQQDEAPMSAYMWLEPLTEYGYGAEYSATEVANIRKSAEQGNKASQEQLGCMYNLGNITAGNDARAVFPVYKKAAEQGNTEAQYNMAWVYLYGYGVPQNSAEAIYWYKKLADKGNVAAMEQIGDIYRGTGVEITSNLIYTISLDIDHGKHERDAVFWYKRAAEYGSAQAAECLGSIYEYGGDVQDITEAIRWYKKAVELGSGDAALSLGSIFENEDVTEAIKWYKKAASLGEASAYYRLEALGEETGNEIYSENGVVEKAQFPGGEAALIAFMNKTVMYPQIAIDQELQGTVHLRFVVEKDGSIGEVRVMNSLSKECDQAAITALRKAPRFSPAKDKHGEPVRVWFNFPVHFEIH